MARPLHIALLSLPVVAAVAVVAVVLWPQGGGPPSAARSAAARSAPTPAPASAPGDPGPAAPEADPEPESEPWTPEPDDIPSLLASADPFRRKRGIERLRDLGDPGRADWPLLLPRLADEDQVMFPAPARKPLPDRMGWLASDALVRLGARSLADPLRELVVKGPPTARIAAGLALLGLYERFDEAPAVLAEAIRRAATDEGTGWLEATALARAATAVPAEVATADLVEAVASRLPALRSKDAGRALLCLGTPGRERARAVLAGSGTAYERCGVLEALLAEGALGRGLEAELRSVAEGDENAWNRSLAGKVLAGLEGG